MTSQNGGGSRYYYQSNSGAASNGDANNGGGYGGAGGGRRLGMVVGGSLSHGLEVRLDADAGASVEDVSVGSFVTIHGRRRRYFAVVTDLALRAAEDSLRHFPPSSPDGFAAEVMAGTLAYGQLSVMPGMTAPIDGDGAGIGIGNGAGAAASASALAPASTSGMRAETARTIPEHFAPVFTASQADIDAVFRAPGASASASASAFMLGTPQGMEGASIPLDLGSLAGRSVGIFGASGSGKTFLARMLLAGLARQGEAVSLVFDMQNEYGWQGQDNDRRGLVKGLKQLFPSRVVTLTLDEESSRRRGVATDGVVRIGYDEIEPADIEVVRELLNLSEVAAATAYNLERHYGRGQWLREFVALTGAGVGELANEISVNLAALQTLHRRLAAWQRFGFLADAADGGGRGRGSAGGIIEHLQRGSNVVLEFGKYGHNTAAYVLVSNLLSRRIHETWVRDKELADGGQGAEPRPLVIFIEEAHKFLTPAIAGQTIFGAIARELRKYNVTLMIVDQRPSGIDAEVMSQLGTRLCCALHDDRDIGAALVGARDAGQLRGVLARLDSRQQALVFGHAVPMPVVVRPRDYDASFYAAMAGGPGDGADGAGAATAGGRLSESEAERMQREIDELFPP